MGMGIHEFNLLKLTFGLTGPLGRVLTLGRQHISSDARHLLGSAFEDDTYCDRVLIEQFGASSVDSLDYSDMEGASILCDLSDVEAAGLQGREFDSILDFGTLEHVYNVPVAIDLLRASLADGGVMVHSSPTDGWSGHGFYQFSPYFFHQLYSTQNGFELCSTFVVRNSGLGWKKNWWSFKLEDSRLSPLSGPPLTVLALARKLGDPNPKHLTVYQHDYELVWRNPELHGRLLGKPFEGTRSALVGLLRRSLVAPVLRKCARYVADPWSPVRLAFTQIFSWFVPSLGSRRFQRVRVSSEPSLVTRIIGADSKSETSKFPRDL